MRFQVTVKIFFASALIAMLSAPILSMSGLIGSTQQATAQSEQDGESKPTYWIRINPGAVQDAAQHYVPNHIAVPANTTIEWINNEPKVRHTVTSGVPGALDSGALFNSGSMPFNRAFQVTFDKASGLIGDLPYYCTIHPWVTGMVTVSDEAFVGDSFVMGSGTGSTLDLSKNNRTLLVFNPIAAIQNPEVVPANPIFYNFSILKNADNGTVFTDSFQPAGVKLQVELVQQPTANQSDGSPTPFDVSSDAGGYSVAGNIFDAPGNYTIITEVTNVGASALPEQMRDEFQLSVVTNSTG